MNINKNINKNEQHQITWHNTASLVFLFFLPNKLAPHFSGVSLFGFSLSICPPRHGCHENSAILSGWKLQEYLASSPEDRGTNSSLSKFNLVKFLIIKQTRYST